MKRCVRPLTALAACFLLFTAAGCGDKHEPTKPTVISAVVATLLPPF
jgi:hypothetical protein